MDAGFLHYYYTTLLGVDVGVSLLSIPSSQRGVVRLDVKLQSLDINQCASGPGWFAGTHQCDLNSTECVAREGAGFVLGGYVCICKPGFYGTRKAPSSGQAWTLENSSQHAQQYGVEDSGSLFGCRPCRQGCATCVDDSPCFVQEDWSLRAAILAFQAFCMLAVFISMLVCYHFRKSKRIRASGVILLETILFGSLLLYFPVFILYFKPSIFRCLVLRWVRMLGFAIVYGTITLKLYRVLKVFLSRTAQRVPYMTSARVLKMLAVILLLVLWFLVAWTVGMLENMDRNIPLVIRSQTPGGLHFYICDHDRWDYMMVVAEFIFLCWGSFLCYTTKTVPSAYHEPRYMGVALHNEMLISAAFHIVRFVMVPTLHPDWTLLLFFIHTHVTITLTLALLFIPKFLHAGSPMREEIASEVYEDELDLRRSGSYLNSSITSAWSEHSLDPDDIRDELKKLYAQLEVHKTKKMTTNNPHLQKKRSSRRGLGRSIMRRITEIPDSVSRQHSRDEKDASGGGGSYPGSYKKKLCDSGSSSVKVKDDSLKHKVVSLKKSHSTYDNVEDQKEHSPPRLESSSKDSSLRDSLMRRKLAKKASQKSNNGSMDEAPLVYKSVSAHNLLAEKRPLHPKGCTLQKSLSVLTSNKEKAQMLTSKDFHLDDSCQIVTDKVEKRFSEGDADPKESDVSKSQDERIDQLQEDVQEPANLYQGIRSTLLAGSFDKAEVCPWELQDLPSAASESKAHKHVTYAPIKCSSVDAPHLPEKLCDPSGKPDQSTKQQSLSCSTDKTNVCPWEYQEPVHSEDEALAASKEISDSRSSKLQQSEVSPEPNRKSDNICTNEISGKEKDDKDKKLTWSPLAVRVSPGTAPPNGEELCPWECPTSAALASLIKERPFGPRSTSEDIGGTEEANRGIFAMKTQSLKELPQKKTLKGLVLAMRAFKAPLTAKTASTEKQQREKEGSLKKCDPEASSIIEKPCVAEVCPWDTEIVPGSKVTQDGTKKTTKHILERASSKLSEICPWECEETVSSQKKNVSSKTPEACPRPANGQQTEVDQNDPSCARKTAMEKPGPLGNTKDATTPKVQKQSSIREMVCPWESIEEQSSSNLIKSEGEVKKMTSQEGSVDSKREDICPWESKVIEEPRGQCSLSEKKHALQSKSMSKKSESLDSKRGDICPWESLDSEEPLGSLSKSESRSSDQGVALNKSESIDSRRDLVCPWETEEDTSVKAEICPWESSDALTEKSKTKRDGLSAFQARKGSRGLKDASRDTSGNTTPNKLERLSHQRDTICPWESLDSQESLATLSPSTSKLFDQGPIVSKTSDSLDSKRDEICPWESVDSEEPLGTMSKSGSRTSEQDISLPRKSDSTESRREEVCPWEALEVNSSIKVEVCPWEEESITPTIPKQPTIRESSHLNVQHTLGSQQQDGDGTWEYEDTMPLNKTLSKSEEQMSDMCEEMVPHSKSRKWNYSLYNKPSDSMVRENEDKQITDKRTRAGMNEGHSRKSPGTQCSTGTQSSTLCHDLEKASSLPGHGMSEIPKVDSLRATICPWELPEDPRISTVEESSQAHRRTQEACPMETKGQLANSPILQSKAEEQPKDDAKMANPFKKPEVCPWDFE